MLDEFSTRQMVSFFNAIAPWRNAYRFAWFTYIAKQDGSTLKIIAARLFLTLLPKEDLKEKFSAGNLQAGQFIIDQKLNSIEDVVCKLMSANGFEVSNHGTLLLSADEQYSPSLSQPLLLHPDGLRDGNRLAVLTASSVHLFSLMTQPETDWILKAATRPYDSFNELRNDYCGFRLICAVSPTA
jgi:hypothetical protein